MTRICVIPGHMDPLTLGHLHVIKEATELFDETIVLVTTPQSSHLWFSLDERIAFTKEATEDLPGVKVLPTSPDYIAIQAKRLGATHIVRGLLSHSDHEAEATAQRANQTLLDGPKTVFIIPPDDLCMATSAFVKGLVGPIGWVHAVEPLVPAPVRTALLTLMLRIRWQRLFQGTTVKPAFIDEWFRKITAAYTESHRHYHDLSHLCHIFAETQRLDSIPRAVEFALWFHDFVYDPMAHDNEEASADVAMKFCKDAKLDKHTTDRIMELILATKTHSVIPREHDAALITSLDLSMFGRPFSEFEKHIKSLLAEHSCATRVEYFKTLQNILGMSTIYGHPSFCDYEVHAKSSLAQLF